MMLLVLRLMKWMKKNMELNKVDGYIEEQEAIKHFYKQLLTGDRTDNIRGLEGIGNKKAEKILKGLTKEKELYKAVLEKYNNNKEYLLEQGRLLWIRKKKNQLWKLPKL